MTDKPKWPRERVSALFDDRVEYKREPPRHDNEATSYVVATLEGLLLGRVWRPHRAFHCRAWYAEGWTPRTDGLRFGPFDTRWEAMGCLLSIETRDRWPSRLITKRKAVAA